MTQSEGLYQTETVVSDSTVTYEPKIGTAIRDSRPSIPRRQPSKFVTRDAMRALNFPVSNELQRQSSEGSLVSLLTIDTSLRDFDSSRNDFVFSTTDMQFDLPDTTDDNDECPCPPNFPKRQVTSTINKIDFENSFVSYTDHSNYNPSFKVYNKASPLFCTIGAPPRQPQRRMTSQNTRGQTLTLDSLNDSATLDDDF